MRVLSDSWCFCNGGGKTERMKAAIFSGKGPAMARIFTCGSMFGNGFLIHPNLLLTSHTNLPSVASAEAAEIRLQNGVAASLFPHRFFITSSVLDLTIVGLDSMNVADSNTQSQQPHYLKTSSKPNLDLGNIVYVLGYAENKEFTIGEGKVIIATDNLIKLSTDGVTWSPGSAGFDIHGNLAFMVCDPMKLAKSPTTKSYSISSCKKDVPMQFGIPIPIICDWLNQHWEGYLDELNKPKLPLIRLMSAGQKSDHSCASFTMRRVFKPTEAKNDESSSNIISRPNDPVANEKETLSTDPHGGSHVQGIPTPEIYESRKLNSVPFRKMKNTQIQLLDINFPPRGAKGTSSPQPARKLEVTDAVPEIESITSVYRAHSGVQSCGSPVEASEGQNGYSSEGETTMYSAETAESHNYTSPREGKFQQVGRSQSCVNYNRWRGTERNTVDRMAMLEKQRNTASQRSNEYFSPTVSSIMKKRNNLEQQQPNRPRQTSVHSSSKWMF